MRVFLTGGTGYLGGAVLRVLVSAGHDVRAVAHSDESAAKLAGAGVQVVVGDLMDADWLRDTIAEADAVVHAASTGDASTALLDDTVIAAVGDSFERTDRAFVYTGGTWALGSGRDLDESSPWNPIPIVSWRPERIDRVLALARTGVRAVVVSPPDLYGDGQGLFPSLASGPVAEDRLLFPGSGEQLVASVHAADIAALYLAAVEQTEAAGHVVAAAAESYPMRQLAEAAAKHRGLAGASPEPEDASRERLGPLYDSWLLDQTIVTDKARRLGWEPVQPTVLEVLAEG